MLMPSESEDANTGSSAARTLSTVFGWVPQGPKPTHDGPTPAAPQCTGAEPEAAAGDPSEGDELLRRMQSALADDDSVDLLLPSLTALRMFSGGSNTDNGGGLQPLEAATPSVDSSGRAWGLIQPGSGSSSEAAFSPVDPSARSRNLGLGLAALHKLQQQQRMAQEQQQQQQQQQQEHPNGSSIARQDGEQSQQQQEAQQQHCGAFAAHQEAESSQRQQNQHSESSRAQQDAGQQQELLERPPEVCSPPLPAAGPVADAVGPALSREKTVAREADTAAVHATFPAAAAAVAAASRSPRMERNGLSAAGAEPAAEMKAAIPELAETAHASSGAGELFLAELPMGTTPSSRLTEADAAAAAVGDPAAAAAAANEGSRLAWGAFAGGPTALCLHLPTADEAEALRAAGDAGGSVEAAVRAEAETVEALARQLQQQVEQLLHQHKQRGGPAAIDALTGIEQRLKLALEAVDADVAALQREAKATAAATVPPASATATRPSPSANELEQLRQLLQQQQQRDVETSHGDEGEGEEDEGFKAMDSLDSTTVAAAAAASGSAAAAGLWSGPCRALLRAALQSAGRQLPRGRRRGARGAPREWGEAARHRPPLDVLCRAAAQTKAECSLAPDEAAAAVAAAAVAATAAAASGSEAAAAAAAAAEALLLPAAATADGVRRVPWLPAEGPMVDGLAAVNHGQAFVAGLPLLREICRVATVELRAPPPPAVAAAAEWPPKAAAAAAPSVGMAGLRRLGLSGEQQLPRRGPVWVEAPSAEEEEEGQRGAPPPLLSSCSEQLMLFLRRELFPLSWQQLLQQQPLVCKAQLLLPSEYEEGGGAEDPLAEAGGPQGPPQPILRLRRFRRVFSSAAGVTREDATAPAAAATAATTAAETAAATAAETAGATAATTAAATGPGAEEATGAPERPQGRPLMIDDALVFVSKQQQQQQQCLEQLLQQLRHLSRGISMQQLVLLASLVDSMGPADAAAAAAAVGEPDAVVFSDASNHAGAAAEGAAVGDGDSGETPQQQQQQQLEQLQKLQQWLSTFQRFGISAGRAVALLAVAGEQQQQQLEPEGEPIEILLTFSSLMPFPEEDPGIVAAFSLPYKPSPLQPWKWDLRVMEGGARRHRQGAPMRGPMSIQNVRRQIAHRQQRLTFLLQQQKIICKAFYKSWRSRRRQLERRRLAAGDVFGWGILPVRAIDHPSLLMALPAGFRQGNPKEPYEKQYSRDAAEEGISDRSGARRSNDVTGRRTLRGDACNDRQRAKEEAANRESKREWMQANFSNLTGPGVFWRESCLFSQGQSLRQRLEKQQENSGVHPVELLQTDPDWALFDWERECRYICNTARVLKPVEQEAERKAVTIWAEAEARTFVEKFLMYPKNFEKIAACLDGKTTRDCVDFYYRFKFKFSLKRRLQELEDGTRVKKRNRHVGSKQIRREELVAEAVAGLSSDCGTELMRRFNDRNFLPFDSFSDHLLHRDALQTTLKDPLACRGEDWGDCDSDGAEIFVENMSDGYFLPATTKGLVAPGRVVSIPTDAALWGSLQRTFVPGCLLIDGPPQQQQEGELDSSPPTAAPHPTLKYDQLDTLLTCMQAAARRFALPDEEGPSYMTRSRAARSRPAPLGNTTTAGGPGAPQLTTGARCGGSAHNTSFGPTGGGQQSPRARAMDCLLLRLKGIVRGMQQSAKVGSRERRRCQLEEPDAGTPAVPSSPSSSLRLGGEEPPLATSE